MRLLINLVEAIMTLTPETLTRAIETAVQQCGIAPERIGSGHCYDFTWWVLAQFGIDASTETKAREKWGIATVRTEDFWQEDFFIDLDKLRRLGEPVPDDLPEEELAMLLGGATHEWLHYRGRHYDAETPRGVVHFLEMPFFARQIAGLRQELRGDG